MVTSTMTATTIHDFDHHDHYDYNERDQELHDFSATIMKWTMTMTVTMTITVTMTVTMTMTMAVTMIIANFHQYNHCDQR